MDDCLASTGSTAGLDPLIGGLVLLLLGAGVAALAWRHRKRATAGIALLPLVLGVLLFSGLSGSPAQAAPCPTPPPSACMPTHLIEDVAISDARFELDLDDEGLFFVFTLAGPGADEVAGFHEAAAEAGATYSGVLTVTNENGSVAFFIDADGYVSSAEPAMPTDFDGSDIYDLVYSLSPRSPLISAELVVTIAYSNGCAAASADMTVTGGLTTYQ